MVISDYTKRKAKLLNVIVKESSIGNFKLDVFDATGTKLLCSIGHRSYKDYPTYLAEKGKEYADNRRRLFLLRHPPSKEESIKQYYGRMLLW